MDSKQVILLIIPLHSCLIKFNKNKYTLGVFIDLYKAFDTVDHSILLRKLRSYGITDRNYTSIKSYLSKRWQYIQFDENCRTEYCLEKCGYRKAQFWDHCYTFCSLLKNATSALDPIMLADDTSLFYTHSNIQKLF